MGKVYATQRCGYINTAAAGEMRAHPPPHVSEVLAYSANGSG
jgi:hypothetical protein